MAMSRSFGGTSLTLRSPMKISPRVTSSSPAIIRKVVLLPHPEGPTRTTNSLWGMSRSMPRTASVLSKTLATSFSTIPAIAHSLSARKSYKAAKILRLTRGD